MDALADLAVPSLFCATHQYTPASFSLLLCVTFRKKTEPSPRIMRCAEFLRGAPSLNHLMAGSGRPSAPQLRVRGSLRGTVQLLGCSVILGARPSPVGGEEEVVSGEVTANEEEVRDDEKGSERGDKSEARG